MIDINEMYKFVQFISNKEQSGFIKPSEFNIAAERAQMQLFMQRYGNPKEHTPGRPVPRTAFAQSQKIQDDFNAFIMSYDFTDGEIDLDEVTCNYAHLIALEADNVSNAIGQKRIPIKLVDISEYHKLLSSALLPPSASYPVAYFSSNKTIQIDGVDEGTMYYLRFPNTPVWDYFKDSLGNPLGAASGNPVSYPVFDDSEPTTTATTTTSTAASYDCDNTNNPYENSVNFEFPYDCFNEIAAMILSYVGINLREPMLTQYAEAKQQQGI